MDNRYYKPTWKIHVTQNGVKKESDPFTSPSACVDKMAEWINHYKARGIDTVFSLVNETGLAIITVDQNLGTPKKPATL